MQQELEQLHARRSPAVESRPNESAARRRRPTPHFLSNDECSEGTIYSCARRTFVKRPALPVLCVACMHRRGQQCPTMLRHVEFSFTVSAPSRRVDSASATHSTLPPESALRRHLYLMHTHQNPECRSYSTVQKHIHLGGYTLGSASLVLRTAVSESDTQLTTHPLGHSHSQPQRHH